MVEFEAGSNSSETDNRYNEPSHCTRYPSRLCCSLSRKCMQEPVVLADGFSYERRNAVLWLKNHDTSPVTGTVLEHKRFIPNHSLRIHIEEWLSHNSGKACKSSSLDVSEQIIESFLHSLFMNADFHQDSYQEAVLLQIMEKAKLLVGAEAACVFLLDCTKPLLYSAGNTTGFTVCVPITSGIVGRVARTGDSLMINDTFTSHYNMEVDIQNGTRTRNVICVPLQTQRLGVFGVAQLLNKHSEAAHRFDCVDLRFFQVLMAGAALCLESHPCSRLPGF